MHLNYRIFGKKTIKSHNTLEYLMAGFPLISQEKHISNLINNISNGQTH